LEVDRHNCDATKFLSEV